MSLSREDVLHIAELAKLELSEEEVAAYQQQLSAILDYVNQLNELDTEAIPPTASVLPLNNVFAEDVPRQPLSREELLANAPEAESGQYRVRAILE